MARLNDKVSRKRYKNAVTQTSPEQTKIEIIRLKEEVDLLRRELGQLKQKQQPSLDSKNQKDDVTVVAAADSPQQQKILGKGCNCRGKCANRICGCVKRQTACTAACNCKHEKCQNQEHPQEADKENISSRNVQEKVATEVEENTKLLSELNLRKNHREKDAELAAGSSLNRLDNVRKSGKSLFSPESPKTHRHDVSVGKLQFDTPIKFGVSKENISSNSDSSPEESKKPKQKLTNTRAKSRKETKQIKDRKNSDHEPEFETIDPMKPTRQLQRTPVSASPMRKQVEEPESPLPLLTSMKAENRSITPQPEGIDVPLVDWDEHCAQLVPCRFCKRTFYPFRLEKHEASCQRI